MAAQKLFKFRLDGGSHEQLEGKVLRKYVTGDIVTSPNDLRLDFKNKFTLVGQEEAPSKGEPVGSIATPLPGAVPEAAKPKPAPAADEDLEDDDADDDAPGPVGKDVTERFPTATEQDYKVYKMGKEYFVYDAEDLSKPINDAGVTKTGVDKVISDAVAK